MALHKHYSGCHLTGMGRRMMAIERYRKKRDVRPEPDQYAARYTPGEPLGDIHTVARMCDRDAEAVEVVFRTGPVLLVRYQAYHDDRASTVEYQAVEPGQYLAYSGDHDFLYDTTDADWRHWYDRVEEG